MELDASESNQQRCIPLPSEDLILNNAETNVSSIQTLQEGEGNIQFLLTITQVAHLLGVSRPHVYTLIHQGLPTIHLGRLVRVNMVSFQIWILEQEK